MHTLRAICSLSWLNLRVWTTWSQLRRLSEVLKAALRNYGMPFQIIENQSHISFTHLFDPHLRAHTVGQEQGSVSVSDIRLISLFKHSLSRWETPWDQIIIQSSKCYHGSMNRTVQTRGGSCWLSLGTPRRSSTKLNSLNRVLEEMDELEQRQQRPR